MVNGKRLAVESVRSLTYMRARIRLPFTVYQHYAL